MFPYMHPAATLAPEIASRGYNYTGPQSKLYKRLIVNELNAAFWVVLELANPSVRGNCCVTEPLLPPQMFVCTESMPKLNDFVLFRGQRVTFYKASNTCTEDWIDRNCSHVAIDGNTHEIRGTCDKVA